MKTSYKIVAVAGLLSGLALAAQAQTVIGSWQGCQVPPTPGCDEGWQRGQGGFGPNGSIFASSNCPTYFDLWTNVAAGYANSLVVHETGYGNVRLYISLSADQIAAFTNNTKLNFTFSCQPGDTSTPDGYMQIVDFQYNSAGGWHNGAPSTARGWSETGDTNNNSSGQPIYYWGGTGPARQQVVTWDYSSVGVVTQAVGSSYLQFVWVFQVGGHAPTNIFINNVNLSGSTPCTITYIVDDFSTNGVGPTNPTNDDYFATAYDYSQVDLTSVWGPWYGGGCSSVSFTTNVSDPYLNVPGHGAMACNLTWTGTSDQWLLWHHGCGNILTLVPGGTTGIGYPQYTNLSCDVMFDPSSVTNANGVYGVIRLGILPDTTCGADWQVPGEYTTITDTNWHHMSMTLASGNPDYRNIGSVLIGEDEAYLGGVYLNGAQILYVANVKFTGPCVAPVIPPPTLAAPQPATPGLRIFAGDAVNTYDRQELYTTDSSQSWVDPGVTYPVKYSYSIFDYNPNITQIHLELIPGSSGSQYSDWGANNMLWMVLNPGPAAGQVVCNVQWKTNAPNSNPGGTVNPYGNALSFTNSTAVGTWTLVFTSTNTGYVIPPGQVILGPTNFTITDPNVTTDFGEPMYAVFGHQPNSTAGEGAYIDYGMIKVTGVAGVNEFEDFTTEGSDISANLTPSGQFNNNASFTPASTIIVTTNDAWWVNWTQPATGFTLASSTNLVNPNWINPGYYSGYSDTNAPRVMPLAAPFAQNFWVLLPKDDLPPGPKAFFLVATNVVSP